MTAIDPSRRDDAAQRNGHKRRFSPRRKLLAGDAAAGQRVEIPFLDCGPEIAMALGSGSSAFQDVVLAFFFGREDHTGGNTLDCSPADRAVLRDHFNLLVHNFEAEHGRILRSYFARHCLAAAVLTCDDEIEVVLARDVPSSELIQVIRRAQALGYQAWHRLERFDRSLCQRMIFSVILEVLRRLDQSHKEASKTAALTQGEIASLRRNLDEAEDFMLRCATRRAQTEYLRGMLNQGSLLLLVLLGLAAATWVASASFSDVAGQLVLVAIAGAVGATVSVMWRMTSGTFSINLPTLDYGTARSQLRLMGALRPAIGSVFALAIFVFAMSPILPLQAGTQQDTYLLVALGFLAGFSERFAQDMFVRSGQGLAGPGGDSPSSGLSAGLAPPPGGRGAPARAAA